jgi:hypothetical protein
LDPSPRRPDVAEILQKPYTSDAFLNTVRKDLIDADPAVLGA